MPFPRMHDHQARLSRRAKQFLNGRDNRASRRNVVAEHLPEPARGTEIVLHVDHDQRRAAGVELVCVRQRPLHLFHRAIPPFYCRSNGIGTFVVSKNRLPGTSSSTGRKMLICSVGAVSSFATE
ncbi:hypothetical protein D9M72_623430 [compost metagenome]